MSDFGFSQDLGCPARLTGHQIQTVVSTLPRDPGALPVALRREWAAQGYPNGSA